MRKQTAFSLPLATLLLSLGLAGCGGGGGTPPNGQNTAPVAKINPVDAAKVGATVTLDATGSTDADGDTLSYEWILSEDARIAGITLSAMDKAKVTFTAPEISDLLETDLPSMAFGISVSVADGKGGSNTANISVEITEGVAPQLALHFPAAVNTTDSNDDLTFRGTVTDNVKVATIRVNGEDRTATIDDDGTWTLALPVNAGTNNYEIVAVDTAGNVSEVVSAVITQPEDLIGSGPTLSGFRSLARDPVSSRVFAVSTGRSVVGVSSDLDAHTFVYDGDSPEVGSGPQIHYGRDLIPSGDGSKLFVSNSEAAVYTVNLDTLERTETSGPSAGSGDALYSLVSALNRDEDGQLYAVGFDIAGTNNGRLTRIDPVNGNRTTLSESTPTGVTVVGDGPAILRHFPTSGIVVHAGTAWHAQCDILAIDVGTAAATGTGDRTVAFPRTSTFCAYDIVINADGNILWALGSHPTGSTQALFKVPLDGGEPSVVSADGIRGLGEPLSVSQYSLAVDEEKQVAYTTFGDSLILMLVDLVSGDRVLVYNPAPL